MNEHPEGVELGKANHKKVADDEIDTLSVAHLGEIVRDPFQNPFKHFFLVFRKIACAIDVFFYLRKLIVHVNQTILLKYIEVVIWLVFDWINLQIFLFFIFILHIFLELVVEAVSEIGIGWIETVEDSFPFGQYAWVDLLFGDKFVGDFKPILQGVLLFWVYLFQKVPILPIWHVLLCVL